MFRLTVVTVLTLLMFGCAGSPDWVTKGPMNDPCLLYTSPSPRDGLLSRMPSSA